MLGMSVRLVGDEDRERWEDFINGQPEATFFHRFGWRRVVDIGLGHRTWFLIGESYGHVVAVLPLAEVKSVLFGHRLVSIPGGVYGGVVAATVEARQMLTEEACRLAEHLGVGSLELRNRTLVDASWPRSKVYVTFRKAISSDIGANMMTIPRKQRAMVRKGVDAGLQSRVTTKIDEFFPIYAESVRNLGTPVFPRRYFDVLADEFRDVCEITVIAHRGIDIAAVMTFYYRDEVLPYYGGGKVGARAVKGNDFMYWDLMCRAAGRGATMFDFGRSKLDSGSYRFKKNWGFSAEPLAYEYYLVNAKRVPEINPNNPKYRVSINLWKRLPLPVANSVGPLLSRYLA